MAEVNHSSRSHALLSASGAARWLACTPSARLEERAGGKDTSSIYAEEGTLAHELSDIMLHREFKGMKAKTFNSEKRKLKTRVIKLLDELAWSEMEREVQKYVDYVKETFLAVRKKTPDAVLMLEERLDYSHIVPQGFGTGDCIIIADDIMYVIDLKYGKGIQVEAKTNPQAMLYAHGALYKFDMAFDIKEVQMCIVQPRLNNISEWKCSVNYLHGWADKVAGPKAKLAYAGEGEKVAGDHCKWCKVKALCRTYADKNLELAKYEFSDPDLLTLEERAQIYEQSGMLTDWVSSIGKNLFDEAMKGTPIPNHKLVIGRSNRKWTDEQKAMELLAEKGFEESEYKRVSIETITKVQKLVGKDVLEEEFKDFMVKPEGKPTLVHASDKRTAIGLASAKEEFS